MYFRVLANGVRSPSGAKSKAFLLTYNWDDWFTYSTMYALRVYDAEGEEHSVGSVNIGQFNMKEEQRRAAIPTNCDELGAEFFSLGQDDSYYETLNEFGPELRDRILRALRDVALDQDQFQRALDEKLSEGKSGGEGGIRTNTSK